MIDEASFGYLLKQRRKALDLTREELAERVGCAVETLRKIETNARRPSRQIAERLADSVTDTPAERSAFMHRARALPQLRVPDDTRSPQADTLPAPFLPTWPTRLFGREHELAVVGALLCGHDVRLVTLTGPGGVGKTRLALEIAGELTQTFPDGVFFVALGAIADSARVAATIAQALGVTETGRDPLDQRLNDYLRQKHCLLLLDNFEHVIDAAPVVAQILAAASQVKVLVTSRAALQLRGEQQFVVAPLSLPDSARSTPTEVVTQSAAVELFIARARNVRPDFAITSENAQAIAEICVRLDGLPLAIELAAPRSKLFAPQALLARLAKRLPALIKGARDLPIRQQTLRNTISWSYELQAASEQRLFHRLAVFVGGCTEEAIAAVCNPAGDLLIDVMDGLTTLVNNSLLGYEIGSSGAPRFLMLETIREYASERLELSGEQGAIERRHAEYFLSLAEHGEAELRQARGADWLDRLQLEYDNLRAAIEWSFADTDARRADARTLGIATRHMSAHSDQLASSTSIQLGLRLVGAMGSFWDMRGRLTEGRHWLAAALAYTPRGTPEQMTIHAKLLAIAGTLAMREGAFATARSLFDQGLSIYRSLEQPSGIAEVLYNICILMHQQQHYTVAQSLAEESLALYRQVDDRQGIAKVSLMLGLCAWGRGAYATATTLLEDALAMSRQGADLRGVAGALLFLGLAARCQGRYAQAMPLLEESMVVSRKLGDGWNIVRSLINLGNLAVDEGRYAEATKVLEESVAAAQDLSDPVMIAWAFRSLGTAVWLQGDGARALALHQASLPLYRDIDDKWGIAECLEGLAEVISSQSAPQVATLGEAAQHGMLKAVRFLSAAAALRETTGNPMTVAERIIYERTVSARQGTLGQAAFAAAWETGRSTPLEQVIAEALSHTIERAE